MNYKQISGDNNSTITLFGVKIKSKYLSYAFVMGFFSGVFIGISYFSN